MSIRAILLVICTLSGAAASVPTPVAATPTQSAPGQSGVVRRIGTIREIKGTTITLTPDSGPEITVNVQPATPIVRIPPGEKDLKKATPIAVTDLQVGDRVLVGGKASEDAKSLTASSIVVMKASDLEARQQQIRQDWQKRGLGGLVNAVDPALHTVTISVTGSGGMKSVTVHTSSQTVFRRYAPESVKFEDAKPSTLQEIHPGDQLRARGTRGADGTEFSAEEIVTGAFRNIAGTVNSVDAAAGTMTVQDLLSKKSVQVKITADSQLHKLPTEMAQRIAMRLKALIPAGIPGGASRPADVQTRAPSGGVSPGTNGPGSATGSGGGVAGGGMGGGMRSGGAPDFQQMLSHMPALALGDLHKGDAVMLVATLGTPASASTAITLLSGVEPILEAAPSASQAMMLAPWTLGGAPIGDASQ
jgi:hypothetical protein